MVELQLKSYDYFRVQVFLEDFCEFVQIAPTSFQVPQLLGALYTSFLKEIRSRDLHFPDVIANLLEQRKRFYQQEKATKAELTPKTHTHWVVRQVEVEVPSRRQTAMLRVEFEFLRKAVLRGEVFLMDLAYADERFQMSFPELLAVIFANFAEEVKKGKQHEMMESMIQYL